MCCVCILICERVFGAAGAAAQPSFVLHRRPCERCAVLCGAARDDLYVIVWNV